MKFDETLTYQTIYSLLTIIRPSVKYLEGEIKDEFADLDYFTATHTLERTINTLDSLAFLLSDAMHERNERKLHDHAVGLLSRNLLSDFLTVMYIFHFSDSEVIKEQKCATLIYSDINRLLNPVALMRKYISPDEVDKHNMTIAIVEKERKDIYDNYKPKKFPAPGEIIAEVCPITDRANIHNEMLLAYDVWTLLCKYEHIGLYSHKFTRSPYVVLEARVKIVLRMTTLLTLTCLKQVGMHKEVTITTVIRRSV